MKIKNSYRLYVAEYYTQSYDIEADSIEKAIEGFNAGMAEDSDMSPLYERTLTEFGFDGIKEIDDKNKNKTYRVEKDSFEKLIIEEL